MNIELKKDIFNWLVDNENRWQRVNKCIEHYKNYIYNDAGSYIIGGEEVSVFIAEANKLLYK